MIQLSTILTSVVFSVLPGKKDRDCVRRRPWNLESGCGNSLFRRGAVEMASQKNELI